MGSSSSTGSAGSSQDGSGSSPSMDQLDTVVSATVELGVDAIRHAIGSMVSRYVVLDELGRGGMGRVLRAYDPTLQREVALKELHRVALDEEGAARLVVEARAMAKLSHPHVVAIYDVEETGLGQVVLVMEHVRGTTLRQWLGAREREWPAVLAVLMQAGRGLAAAHAAGLMHRDFKPSNVLVGEDGTAKVMDFGLAKMAGDGSSSEPLSGSIEEVTAELTQAGTVMGTPRYMAPEQHRAEPLGPAADQFAFCVTLWEALCGAPPFVGAAKELLARKLSPPPTWPKAGVPRPIVDAIVRGLSPKPEGRWPSMEALLEALSWAPTRGRNRWLFAAASLCVLGAGSVALATWAQARATRCSGGREQLHGIWDETRRAEVRAAIVGIGRSYATRVWERTERELDAYASDWAAMHTEACEATTVRGEQSTQAMDLRMGCLRRTAQELRATVDTLADADEEMVQNAQKLTSDLPPLSRCADVEALSAEVEPPLPAEAEVVERIRGLLAGAKARVAAGRYGQAQEAVQAAKQALAGVQYGPVHTEVALHDGLVLDVLGRYEEAEAALTEALTLATQWRQWEEVLSAANQLMRVVGDHQRRMDEGLRYWPLAKGLSHGRPQAEASARNNLATILGAQGKHAEAEAEHRAALALREEALGPDHPDVAGSRDDLAGILVAQGKHAEAEAELRAALSLWERVLGPDHPEVAMSRSHLAIVLASQGKHDEAEAELRATLARLEEAMGPHHPHVALSRSNLAKLLHEQGKHDEAEAEHRVALELLRNALGSDHLEVASSRYGLAGALFERGKYEEAEPELRAVLTTYEKTLGPAHPEVATARRRLANVLLELEKATQALPLAEQAWERWQQGDASDGERAATAFVLARASWIVHPAEPERTRARALAEEALRSYRETEDAHASGCASAACREEADEVRQWLDEHPLL